MAAFRNNEDGFVLITAIWLLILCGAVAALLLARSLSAATAVAADAEALRTKLARDAAIETVMADLLINGRRSPFAMLPTEGIVTIGEQEVRVRIGSESGKLDLNEGDLALIDRVMAGLGWDSAARALFAQQLRTRREAGQPLRSPHELRFIAARSRPDSDDPCLEAYFTVHGGRPEPDPAFTDAELSRLLGRPPMTEGNGPQPAGAGTPLRIEASIDNGAARTAVLRIGGLLEQPVTISSWQDGRLCDGP